MTVRQLEMAVSSQQLWGWGPPVRVHRQSWRVVSPQELCGPLNWCENRCCLRAMSIRDALPRLDTKRPFTRAQAVQAGIDPRSLRSRRYRPLFRGVYVESSVPITPQLLAQAALVLHPESAFASHVSAAALRGLPVPDSDRVHVTVMQQEERVQRHGIACHIACSEAVVQEVRGVRVSSPLDLFFELAGVLPLVELVVAGDAMVRSGHFTADELRKACRATKRWHSRRARRGAAYVRDEVDSPMETRLRMLLVLAGLPEPKVNHGIYNKAGRLVRRLDLSFPNLRLIIEYDGRHHVEVQEQWESDIDRREEIEGENWRFILVTSKGVYVEPERTIMRVARAIRQRGGRVGPIREDWKAHFPVK